MNRIIYVLMLLFAAQASAQMVEVQEESAPVKESAPSQNPKDKAGRYFQDRKKASAGESGSGTSASGDAPRYLALHVGTFFNSDGYKWGDGDQRDLGKLNIGVDYRLGEWINTADLALRIDFTTYGLEEGWARKLSVGGIITFPDVNSRFPLYFGAGLGAGFFVKQIHNESAMALDYSLLAGVRFLNVIDQLGFLVETGIKNHLHLFSDGQFNGIYFNVGTVFAF